MTLTLRHKEIKCGEEVYTTNQKGIYAISLNTIAAKNIQLRHGNMSNRAKVQVDERIRLHTAYQKLEAEKKKLIDQVIKKQCEDIIDRTNRIWQSNNQNGHIVAIRPKLNTFMMVMVR